MILVFKHAQNVVVKRILKGEKENSEMYLIKKWNHLKLMFLIRVWSIRKKWRNRNIARDQRDALPQQADLKDNVPLGLIEVPPPFHSMYPWGTSMYTPLYFDEDPPHRFQ